MSEQTKLFEPQGKPTNIPLAERVRPQSLDDIVGQEKLLADGSVLHRMFDSGRWSSMILWGPPGSGKTTLARLIEKVADLRFIAFSAVLVSIKDVRAVMKEAEYELHSRNRATILFIDEIHRFNKSQQDAFLHYVESGAIVLVGATTENPSFEVIPALLSRCHVLVLERLADDEIERILSRAIERAGIERVFADGAMSFLAMQSGGDARKALNNLELLLATTQGDVTVEVIKGALNRQSLFYDKKGEEHYNLISALHKSLRGSDAQAGLYWLARMLESGEDPLYIVRRLMRFASEDIGLADPQALTQAVAAQQAVHFLGMPEANIALAQLVVYLATAPKSNALYTGYKQAADDAKRTSHLGVPLHIRNAPTKLMKKLDYGKDYAYDHEFDQHYHYQKRFPDKMNEQVYYEPSQFGFEREVRKRLDWWAKLRLQQEEELDK
ncbi:MAG: replication-associated recombination protein A [Candidatus Cloacimonetes bacterium]|nr:replication-associated recombination protein A [Candidatus Cloacimonadota bacterium]